MKVERWQLEQRQGLPLKVKIRLSEERIKAWYNHYDGAVCVSFSGGMDSTVLLHLVRKLYPDVPGVFFDTGLEYPEIREHVMATKNVITVRPKMSFAAVIEKYGYPVVSKRIALYVDEIRRTKSDYLRALRLNGIRKDGTYSPMSKISNKWKYLIDAPFKISNKCCDQLKKRPADIIQKKLGYYPYVGTRAEEGTQRELSYYMYGCNAFDQARPRSTPVAFWLDSDIWEYVRAKGLKYSEIYDMGYNRTGCMFCMFGVHMEKGENRFQKMFATHPKKWLYCMDKLGLQKVMDYMGIPTRPDTHKQGVFDFRRKK